MGNKLSNTPTAAQPERKATCSDVDESALNHDASTTAAAENDRPFACDTAVAGEAPCVSEDVRDSDSRNARVESECVGKDHPEASPSKQCIFEDCKEPRVAEEGNNSNTNSDSAFQDSHQGGGNCAKTSPESTEDDHDVDVDGEDEAEDGHRAGAAAKAESKAAEGKRHGKCHGNGKGTSLKGAAARVRRGVHVRIHSLAGAPQLNGSSGLCLYQGLDDRWVVHLDAEPQGNFRNVRQSNLQVVSCGGESKKAAASIPARKRPREDQENQPLARHAVVRGIVELECEELRRCPVNDRGGLKRRLLLKWHPDKAPSEYHRVLQTEVTQAMQSTPQWKY